MATMTSKRAHVNPIRRTARPIPLVVPKTPVAPAPVLASELPTIDGTGLSEAEAARVGRARNRTYAAYAQDCPDMDGLDEASRIARKAAADELRRTLRDRPAASDADHVIVATEMVEAAPIPVEIELEPLPARLPRNTDRPERPKPYTAGDAAWWAANSPSCHYGYDVLIPRPAPIRGGAPVRRNRWDALAAESAAQEAIELGLIPRDIADDISRTTLVGHPA